MARVEGQPRSRLLSGRSLLGKAAVVYIVLACLGVGVLLSFVPNFFSVDELSTSRLLALIAVVVFVVGPVAAVGYFLLEATVEGAVRGVGWLLQTCFRAVRRFFKRLFGGSEGQ
jgi:hypothetical protein